MAPTLSIVMPAYNEAESLPTAILEIEDNILQVVPDSELIVVNDGSRDRTAEVLDGFAKSRPWIRAIHQPNQGHGQALLMGLSKSAGEWLLLMDSDRQIPVDNFSKLWNAHLNHDAVFGIRRNRHDPLHRLLLTRLVRLILLFLFGTYLKDSNVPFKLIRRTLWTTIRQQMPKQSLIPSLLMAIAVKRSGARLAQIEVSHQERKAGVCSLRLFKLGRFCMHAFVEVVRFRFRQQ